MRRRSSRVERTGGPARFTRASALDAPDAAPEPELPGGEDAAAAKAAADDGGALETTGSSGEPGASEALVKARGVRAALVETKIIFAAFKRGRAPSPRNVDVAASASASARLVSAERRRRGVVST